jgi:hypothetical protein
MTQHKYSEGPWQLIDGIIQCKDGLPPFTAERSVEERKANTHLMTDAPELLAACEEAHAAMEAYIVLTTVDHVSDSEINLCNQLYDAIAKALYQ